MSASTVDEAQAPAPSGRAFFIDTKSFVFWVMSLVGIYAGIHMFESLSSSIAVKAEPAIAWLAVVEWSIYGGVFFAVVYAHQLFVRRSPQVTIAALLWGGVVATWFASQANAATEDIFDRWFAADFNDRWGTALSAATNEEVLKSLGIVALALLPLAGLRTTLDGWFYGMMIGLGFQLVEDYMYTTDTGSLSEAFAIFLQRGLFAGLFAHAVYTGIIGAGVGYFVSHRDQPMLKRFGVAAGLFAIVWLVHFTWDAAFMNELLGDSLPGFVGAILIKGLPALFLLLMVVRWGRTTERKTWSEFVERHIDPTIVPPDDARALLHRDTRHAARKEAVRLGGHHAGAVRKHLQLAQLRYVQSVMEEGPGSTNAVAAAANVRDLQAMN